MEHWNTSNTNYNGRFMAKNLIYYILKSINQGRKDGYILYTVPNMNKKSQIRAT